jgi:hypothetical protein
MLCCACASSPPPASAEVAVFGRVELAAYPAIVHFEADLEHVGLQPVGHELSLNWKQRPVSDGWRWLGRATETLTIAVADSSARLLASGQLPAGDYYRVWSHVDGLRLLTEFDTWMPVADAVEPIGLQLTVPEQGRIEVEIEVVVLPSPATADHYTAFTRSARIR